MLRGYILKITGKHPHDFIKRLLSLSVNLYEIKIFKNYVLIKVNELDFKKIKNLKTSYEIEIIAYVGFNLLSYLIKKYYIFVCSLLWGFIVFLIVSNLTFDIDIIHQDENVRNEVKRMVIQEGLIPYHFQVNFKKKEAITKNILLKNKDKIEWLEIEKKGVKYIVHLTLRKIINPSTDILPQNIVAAKDGMIINITASQGEVVKKKYDYVKKGDILITGVIKNGDLFMKNVKALGKVEAEVWYQSQIEMPLYFYDAKETGKKKKV
ncbi:MAG: sporulation protein YqfD, partial [Bacilli bacterium]